MEEVKINWIFALLLCLFCPVSILFLGGNGIISFLIILCSFVILITQRPKINLTKAEKWLVYSMVLFPLITLISIWLHASDSYKYFDNPSRLFLALGVFFAIRAIHVKVSYFYYSIVLGAILIGSIALYQSQFEDIYRVYGYISHPPNPITFGNVALMLGILSVFTLSALKEHLGWYAIPLVGIAVILGVLGSLLSGTRGGWISLPILVAIISYWIFGRRKRYQFFSLISVLVFFFLASLTIPVVGERISAGYLEIVQIMQGHWTGGSVGTRLQMWYAAILAFWESPFIGVGLGQYFEFKKELVEVGLVKSNILSFPYAHNELLHYLAEMGLLGFIPLVLLYFGWLYLPSKYTSQLGQTRDLAYMALSIAVFRIDIGLTEVQFNYHFTSVFYVMLFVITAGFMCRPAKDSGLGTKQ